MALSSLESSTYLKPVPPVLQLITPSASPPVSLPSSSKGPPLKRARLSTTPSSSSSSLSRRTPSVSTPAPSDQSLHDARRASSLRVLNVWSSLAERYNKPLAEDDIIDLREGKIIKDRGVLRRANRTYEIGCFTGAGPDEDASSEGGDGHTEGEDADDDIDEIDAFDPNAQISEELELEKQRRLSTRLLKQLDDEDLEEFLEADKEWKEKHGYEEDEGEEEEEGSGILGGLSLETGKEGEGYTSYDEELADSGRSKSPRTPQKKRRPSLGAELRRARIDRLSVPPGEDSDDELATWDFDQSTPMRPTPALSSPPRFPTTPQRRSTSARPRSRSRSRPPPPTVEIIDLTTPSPPKATSQTRGRLQSRVKSKPPASRGKSISKPRPSARSRSSSRRIESIAPPQRPPSPVLQLHTPPRSSESDAQPSEEAQYDSPPRSLSPTKPTKTSARTVAPPRPTPRPLTRKQSNLSSSGKEADGIRSQSPPIPASTPNSKSLSKNDTPLTPLAKARAKAAHTKPKLIAEVVISTPSKKAKTPKPSKTFWSPPRHSETEDFVPETPEQVLKIDKRRIGKEKAMDPISPLELEGDKKRLEPDRSYPRSKSPSNTKKGSSSAAKHVPTSPDSSFEIPKPIFRKRKRVVSSSSSSSAHSSSSDSGHVPAPRNPTSHTSSTSRRKVPAAVPSLLSPAKAKRIIGSSEEHYQTPEPARRKPSPRKQPKNPRSVRLSSPLLTDPSPRSSPAFSPAKYPHNHDSSNIHIDPRPNTHSQPQSTHPPPIFSDQDQQAQFYIAQAVHHLSYLIASGRAASFPPGGPGYPFPQHHEANAPAGLVPWPPLTPTSHRHKHRDHRGTDQSSSPSRPSSFNFASQQHYSSSPYTYQPDYFSGPGSSLPPSSPPISSSPIPSSPVDPESLRPRRSSMSRGRSRSRGRRVSFKLDDDQRPRVSDGEEDEERQQVTPPSRQREEMSPEIPLPESPKKVQRQSRPKVDHGHGRGRTPGPSSPSPPPTRQKRASSLRR